MTNQPRIIYPRPICKAAKYRRPDWWIISLFILAFGVFVSLMRSLPYLLSVGV